MTSEGDDANQRRARLSKLVDEAEGLISAIGDEGAARYRDAVTGLKRQIRRARDDLDDLQYSAVRQARLSARAADRYVQDNPWKSAGAAALGGIAIGAILILIFSRRGP